MDAAQMQTYEELIRQFPDRSDLLLLRARILSDELEQELDVALHKELYQPSAALFEVAVTHIYQFPNETEHQVQKPQWLWSRNESIGWVDDDEVTHYWAGVKPGFWDDLLPVPRYTTRVEDALNLKWTLLGASVQVILEERVLRSQEGDGQIFTREYLARVMGLDQTCRNAFEHDAPAKAILVALIDYLLSIGGPA